MDTSVRARERRRRCTSSRGPRTWCWRSPWEGGRRFRSHRRSCGEPLQEAEQWEINNMQVLAGRLCTLCGDCHTSTIFPAKM